jgi:glycosylphosphatidylinositol transamidase
MVRTFSTSITHSKNAHLVTTLEGVNGVLPNQDLLNAIYNIARYTAGVPVQYHSISDNLASPALPTWTPSPLRKFAESPAFTKYYRGVRHLRKHFSHAAIGKPAGAHGTFAKYRIEGVTLFAEPATGPHGFHALGM